MDARVERTRNAVIRTATDLLVEGGPSAVTIDAIVARSGVAKSTIYRHWESRDDVLISVIEECAPHLEAPDPSLGFEQALRVVATEICDSLNDPKWGRILPALLMLKTHQEGIADIEQRMEHKQDANFAAVVELGIKEGALPEGTDVLCVAAQLAGPMLFARLTGRPPLSHEFAERIVDGFLDSLRANSPERRR